MIIDETIWKDIEGYEGLYMVNMLGRVMSLPRNTARQMLLKKHVNKHGYVTVTLSKNGVRKTHKVHRLVMTAFVPNVDNKPFVNHIDGDKQNNNISNLEWCTRLENAQHASRMGLVGHYWRNKQGKDVPMSRKIKQYTMEGMFVREWDSMSDVMRELNIPVPHLVRVCKGRRKSTRGFVFKYSNETEVVPDETFTS